MNLCWRVTTPGWRSESIGYAKWYLLEEIEHRNVAYDIYQHLYGNYLVRAGLCWMAQHQIGTAIPMAPYRIRQQRKAGVGQMLGATLKSPEDAERPASALPRRFNPNAV